jgi:4-amino-4-deoxy-L-arabinose transferase-like glycosyltransferase
MSARAEHGGALGWSGMPTERKISLALFAIALGLRVLYGSILATHTELAARSLESDLAYAKEIASGIRWITEPYSPRSPGYPVVLGAIYLLSAKQMWLVTFFQAILGALTVVVVYRLGRYMLDVPFATVAALWFAFHVHHMHLSYVFQRDILAILLFMLALVLLVRPFVKMRYAPLAGIVYAVLIHVDPQYIVLLPVLAVFVLFKTRYRLLNIQYLFVLVGVLVVMSIPWTIRNYVVYDQVLPIGLEARKFLRPVKLVVTEPETGSSEIGGKVVMASRTRIIEHNAGEFWRVARFSGDTVPEEAASAGHPRRASGEPAWSRRHNAVSIINYGIMLPFFLLGTVMALKRRHRVGIMLAAVIFTYFLMRTYLSGSEESRLPIDPLIILLAFYGIAAIFGWVRHRRASPEAKE